MQIAEVEAAHGLIRETRMKISKQYHSQLSKGGCKITNLSTIYGQTYQTN